MSKITLDTSGLDTILRDLKQNKRAALEDIGGRVKRRATELVPVDTGFLRSTIAADVEGDRLNVHVDADYAGFVEFGTSRMSAQPYLLPAVREVERQIPEIMALYLVNRGIGGRLRNLVSSIRHWVFG